MTPIHGTSCSLLDDPLKKIDVRSWNTDTHPTALRAKSPLLSRGGQDGRRQEYTINQQILPNQPTYLPTHTTIRPTNGPTDQPTNGPSDQPTDGPTDRPIGKPTDRPANQRTDQPTYQRTDQSTNRSIDQQTDRTVYRPVHRPVYRPVYRPIYQPTNTQNTHFVIICGRKKAKTNPSPLPPPPSEKRTTRVTREAGLYPAN